MKLLTAFLLLSPLLAQVVTVSQVKTNPDGTPAGGTASIRLNSPCIMPATSPALPQNIGDKTILVKFSAGLPGVENFSVPLVRNDTCTPVGATSPGGTYYTVTWQLTGGRQTVEQWVVTDSGAISVTRTPPYNPTTIPQWPAGPKGDKGDKGDTGPQGAPGSDGSGSGAWGGITGTLASQTDLWGVLSAKQATISGAPGTWPSSFTPVAHAGTHAAAGSDPLTLSESQITSLTTDLSGKEPVLGNPGSNGYVLSSTTGGTRSWIANGGGSMVYPGAGIPVSTGSAWGTSIAAPSGALVGTTDTQTLSGKTVDGVSPTTFGYLDPTSSVQTQLNGKQATISGAPGSWPTIPSNTSQISESGNLYFTNARAQAALAGLYQTPISGAPGTWPSLATVATSGSYADLSSKPTIPAAQVNSDWNAVSGLPQIQNKPTLGGAAALNVGTGAGTVAAGDDSRLTNARTPTAHASTHQNGGSDEIATSTPGANAIPKAGAGGTLAANWIPTLNQNTTGTAGGLTGTALTGAITNSGNATTLVANGVTADKMAVVLTRRVCDIAVGDTSGSALANAQLGPQKRICYIPAASTIVEMDVAADGGTPSVIVAVNHAGTPTNIVTGALATAASGGIACSKTSGIAGLDGATTCSATLQNTSMAAGDYLELVSGTAGGTAKWMTIHIIFTTN